MAVAFAATVPRVEAQPPRRSTFVRIACASELGDSLPVVAPAGLAWTNGDSFVYLDGSEYRLAEIALRDLSVRRVYGREGDGPGEFRRPGALGVSHEGGFLIWDAGRQRLIRTTAEFALEDEASFQLPWSTWGFVTVMAPVSDSVVAVAAKSWPTSPRVDSSEMALALLARGSAGPRLVRRFPGDELIVYRTQADHGGELTSVLRAPFGAETIVRLGPATSRSGFTYWVGRTTEPVLRSFRLDSSAPVDSLVIDAPAKAVTSSDRAQYWREQAARFEESASAAGMPENVWRPRFEQIRSQGVDFPKHKPIWEEFALDKHGGRWVRLYEDGPGARVWLHYTATGRIAEQVRVPHTGPIGLSIVAQQHIVTTERKPLTGEWQLCVYGPPSGRTSN
ncbi:MAG TPA: hypothetical protein VFK13_05820 [Gemmatimonadaceae bacterium]|nr:hypothetical protein [Gemmatimonadaceae bacterium]